MPSEEEKQYECLQIYQSLADIIWFLSYLKQTVYNIKKRFVMGMAVNGNLAKGLGEPSLVRKKNKRRRDSLNKMNEDFRKELQMLIYRDPGRAMRGLSVDEGVSKCTIRRSSCTFATTTSGCPQSSRRL